MAHPVHGMQAERTALAWQRTGLSVAVAAAVLARLTYGDLGGGALVVLAVCLGLCGWVMLDTRRRYRGRVREDAARPGIGGWAAAVAVSVVAMGVAELAALVVG
ncbi:DUF202 domain-containing protein [Nocardioides sp. GXQ0305]|uniref:DUF202 domain-containing protein n=1 Tax=Nocardioides sp. GXQ0305 TaxID=3423912 RepID=UPI003D7CF7A0